MKVHLNILLIFNELLYIWIGGQQVLEVTSLHGAEFLDQCLFVCFAHIVCVCAC